MQTMLSHYRILEEIGKGGMGVVYRAHDEHLDCDVALKVLPAGKLADGAARKRFRKEALALSKLNHPNIAVVHDFDTQDGRDFLVEELIPGMSLSEMVISGPLPEREIISLGTQLAEGLAAAHSQGVIHRDLKPASTTNAAPKVRSRNTIRRFLYLYEFWEFSYNQSTTVPAATTKPPTAVSMSGR